MICTGWSSFTPAAARVDMRSQLVTTYDPGAETFRRLDVGQARGSSPRSLEIQTLLRRRLQVLVLIMLFATGFFYAVQVFDYGQADDGTVFYAMEYLAGLSLKELVDRHGPLPAGRTIGVLRQLCGALAEAHAIGLIHRDIKPSNVILCSRGGLHDAVKLLDFGLVRTQVPDASTLGHTQLGLIFGTPAYMSPEQAAGAKDLDARSDIDSLGALAYFLLTGEPPFVRDTVVQTLAAHLNDAAVPLRRRCPELSEDFEAIVLGCLAKHPGQRFADVASLEQALAGCRPSGEWTQTDAAAWWHTVSVA